MSQFVVEIKFPANQIWRFSHQSWSSRQVTKMVVWRGQVDGQCPADLADRKIRLKI
jgi:hypothetical protein